MDFDLKSATDAMDELFKAISGNPELVIRISGHTEKNESADDVKLSVERALKIKRYLMSKGLAESRIFARGYGSERSGGRLLHGNSRVNFTSEVFSVSLWKGNMDSATFFHITNCHEMMSTIFPIINWDGASKRLDSLDYCPQTQCEHADEFYIWDTRKDSAFINTNKDFGNIAHKKLSSFSVYKVITPATYQNQCVGSVTIALYEKERWKVVKKITTKSRTDLADALQQLLIPELKK